MSQGSKLESTPNLHSKLMSLADAVCEQYSLEKMSFDELASITGCDGEKELSEFFSGLTILWEKLEEDGLL
jgi:hypothetical protein